MNPTEVAAIRGLLSALGSRLGLDHTIIIVCRDGVAEMFSASRNAEHSRTVERLKNLIDDAVAAQNIPVEKAEDYNARQN